MECRVAQLARARSLVGFVLHTGGGRRFESAHGNEFLFIAHFDSGVLYVSRHRYRAELNVKQLSFRLNPKSERMLRAGSGQPLPLFQKRKRKIQPTKSKCYNYERLSEQQRARSEARRYRERGLGSLWYHRTGSLHHHPWCRRGNRQNLRVSHDRP